MRALRLAAHPWPAGALVMLIATGMFTIVPVSAADTLDSHSSLPTASTSDAVATRTFLGPLADDLYSLDDTSVVDVAAGPKGFVAVGSSARGAVVWTSPDGATWDRAPDSPAFDDRNMRAVTAGGPGFVVVGSSRIEPVGAGGAVWTSADGRDWQRAAESRQFKRRARRGEEWSTVMEAVTSLADGSLVAVGAEWELRDESHFTRFVAWRSDDGLDWERLPSRRTERRAGSDVVAFRKGWVSVGEGRVRVSRDGRSWRIVRPPACFGTVAAFDGLLIATADPDVCFKDGSQTIWTSSDGIDWQRVDLPSLGRRTPFLSDVTASTTELTIVGSASDFVDQNSEPEAAVWTSGDGSSWQRVDIPLLDEVEIRASAATEDGTVVVGDYYSDDLDAPIPGPVAVRWPVLPTADHDRAAPARDPWIRPPIAEWTAIEGVGAPEGLAVTRLPDGRVLLAGGEVAYDSYEGAKLTRRVVLFDPVTNKVEKAERLPRAASDAAATTGPDGRVYLVPGFYGSKRIQRWGPRTGRWQVLEADVGQGTRSATWLVDGRLLIASADGAPLKAFDPRTGRLEKVRFPGSTWSLRLATTPQGVTLGFTRARAWRYDPDGGWIAGAPNPYLIEARGEPVAVPLSDGRVAVLIPGVDRFDPEFGDPEDAEYLVEFTLIDIYDPETDTWSTEAALPFSGQRIDAVELEDGRLLVAGLRGVIVVDIP